MEIATGGWIFNSQPMALVRQLLRSRVKNLRLTPAPGSIAPDMLIGAGVVASTACVFISFEQFGLAPNFRRAAAPGEVEWRSEERRVGNECGSTGRSRGSPYPHKKHHHPPLT